MKENGFTLTEVLVTMGIIGIVAAMTFPAVTRIMPDKDKGMVLKAFKTINEVNNDILTNPSLYMYESSPAGCSSHILRCTARPVDGKHNSSDFDGDSKYPYLFAESLTLSDNIVSTASNYTFTTIDGIQWNIHLVDNTDINKAYYSIVINTRNPMRQNCTYNSTSCQNPRQFAFRVNMRGIVSADDSDYLTQAYLRNPNDLSDRHADLITAKELATQGQSQAPANSTPSE